MCVGGLCRRCTCVMETSQQVPRNDCPASSAESQIYDDLQKDYTCGTERTGLSKQLFDFETECYRNKYASVCLRIQLQNEMLLRAAHSLEDKRSKIRSYKPGNGVREAGGIGKDGFAIPKLTALLLVGFSGAGKSTLINNLFRVLNDYTTGFNKAQTYGTCEKGYGSLFLQEYTFYEDENCFLVFDSRGFSPDSIDEDLSVLRKWMVEGVHHGEAVHRCSDSETTINALEARGRQGHSRWASKRSIDSVIFVVDAVSVHNMIERHDLMGLSKLERLYKSPYLSFKDDRPVVVMTHGDKLSSDNRILIKIFIGEIFGVSPLNQVFDIACFTERELYPGDASVADDLVLLNMLEFALENADRNFPFKRTPILCLKKAYGAVVDSWDVRGHKQRFILTVAITCFICLLLAMSFSGLAFNERASFSSLKGEEFSNLSSGDTVDMLSAPWRSRLWYAE